MAYHNDDNYHQEHRQLLGQGALVGQTAEGASDENRQQGNNNLSNDGQNDLLELLQNLGNGYGFGPGCSQAQKYGQH